MWGLEGKLSSLKDAKTSVDERLTAAEAEGGALRAKLQETQTQLEHRVTELRESKDKVMIIHSQGLP